LLEGIGSRIQDETGVPVHIAGEPLDCTAIGAGMMLGEYRDSQPSMWRTDKVEQGVQSEATL
jgi:rod shape-determining protein MreB